MAVLNSGLNAFVDIRSWLRWHLQQGLTVQRLLSICRYDYRLLCVEWLAISIITIAVQVHNSHIMWACGVSEILFDQVLIQKRHFLQSLARQLFIRLSQKFLNKLILDVVCLPLCEAIVGSGRFNSLLLCLGGAIAEVRDLVQII